MSKGETRPQFLLADDIPGATVLFDAFVRAVVTNQLDGRAIMHGVVLILAAVCAGPDPGKVREDYEETMNTIAHATLKTIEFNRRQGAAH